ncbi:nucleotidyltransferase family protein [Allomesorhizobium alhagi]|uniref:Nucleotidyltransferase family protein n=1 Tax=Mesorhizobium alhagi CCNWXJ12-2 TaxID=1107882 RepID=H0HKR4_9HYPH|nr:nucleotidyltransferase family protein [Mesorhizobium alhagi]EHK58762.1 hypothetical protein MAXJ12_03608 [Mesorhizobium alhagi CCNWXJ12-2]
MDHLRFSGLDFEKQRAILIDILKADTLTGSALQRARDFGLADWMIVSGAIYNTVWNSLTGKPSGYGIKDIDLFYFDASDLSWEAEDVIIKAGEKHFAKLPVAVEIRNQARVHLWYPERFGRQCPAYRSSAHSLGYFASRTHAVGVRLAGIGAFEVTAPFGLDDIFSFRIVPNRVIDNQATHEEKAARAKHRSPEISVVPW